MRHAIRRVAVVGAATALVLSAAVLARPPGAGAQLSTTSTSVSTPPPLPVGISLVSQSPWVALRGAFTMRLHIDDQTLAANPNAAILIQVHESAATRSGFDEAVSGQQLGGTLSVPGQIRLSTLERDARGDVSVSFGLSGSDLRPAIGVNRPGVYPVEVQLVNTGTATQSFVTWLVAVDMRSGQPIDKKLSVSFVWAAVADPITRPDGSDDPTVVAQMKRGGRLDKIATLLARTPDLPVSLVIGPETAEAWKRLAAHDRTGAISAAFTRVRKAATRATTEVLPTPYVPINVAALEASGLGGYLPEEYAKGSRSLRATLGANPSTQAQSAFIDPATTTDAAVDALGAMLIDRVAVRVPALVPVINRFTPAQAFVLRTAGGGSRALSTAPFVEDLFNGSGPAALRAQRVIAALAEVAYETPSIARGLVIAPPERWNPDLLTMETVAAALKTLPLVQATTLDQLFATISNEQVQGTTVERTLLPATPATTPVSAAEYQRVSDELSAYRDVVGARDPVVVNGQAALLTTLSTSITPERARAELSKIEQSVQSFAGGITADEKRITLTSRRADVPLSFENHLQPARAVTVRVHLESPKLLFPNGPDQLVPLKPGSNTVRFAVEARASGTFPMTISVTSENGKLAFGAPVRVTVRSAVFGGWAVGVTIAALVFLTGWWANHIRRSRRSRRVAAASGEPAPAS